MGGCSHAHRRPPRPENTTPRTPQGQFRPRRPFP
ncbi:hypothetical protein E2C01_006081 [Portunus trituberculatus]|uniref:Uncharacterized protein n=1 Tax=Portunus trituberculatus TaxID=210409 RepID=A0A5B7CVC1_PORTR|nr:hypothetical protein [Portunus trituberculatus]